MARYANQKTIIINLSKMDKEHPYGMYSCAARNAASKCLSHTGMLLWYYLCNNQQNYSKDLSPAAIFNEIGLSESTVKRNINDMIQHGFLVQIEGNKYNFYDFPTKLNPVQTEPIQIESNKSQIEPNSVQIESTPVQIEPTMDSKRTQPEFNLNPVTLHNNIENTLTLHNNIGQTTNEMDVAFKNVMEARNHYISLYGEAAIEEALDLGNKLRDFSPVEVYFTMATLGELPQKESFNNFVIDNDKLSTFINPEAPQLKNSAAAPAPRASSPTKDEYKAKIDIKLHSLVGKQSYDELQKSVADLHTKHDKSYYEIFRLLNSGNDKGFKQHGIGSLFNPESYTCKKIAKELAAEQRLQQNIASAAIANSQQPKPKTYTYEVTPDDLGNRNNKKSTSSPVDDLFAEEE